MSKTETTDAQSFNKNYQTLKRIAEELRQQQEPDIDRLVPLVEEATKAYKVCQARLEAVKKALAEKLPESNLAGKEDGP